MRPVSSYSTPSSSSGSRTSAAPVWACATSETAGRGGVGMDVDVSAVPRREEGMEAWEVMTSEEPGAHAGHRHAGVVAAGGGGHLRQVGGAGPMRHRHGSPNPGRTGGGTLAASSTAWTALRCWPTSRPHHCPTTQPAATTAPARRRLPPRRPHPRPPTDCGADVLAAPALAGLGPPPVRPTSPAPSSTPWSVRAPTLRCSGWPAPGPSALAAAGWRSRRTRTPGPAPSTRGPARRWCWPRAWPTWPASARRRPQLSTV